MQMTDADKEHSYTVNVRWTGNLGQGTANYRGYKRDHEISAPGKPPLPASSDPNFRGDRTHYNPEECWLPRFQPVTCCGTAPLFGSRNVITNYETMPRAQ